MRRGGYILFSFPVRNYDRFQYIVIWFLPSRCESPTAGTQDDNVSDFLEDDSILETASIEL